MTYPGRVKRVQIVGGPKDGHVIDVDDPAVAVEMPEPPKLSWAVQPEPVEQDATEPEYVIVGNTIKVRHVPRPAPPPEPVPDIPELKITRYQIRRAYGERPDGTFATWHVALHPSINEQDPPPLVPPEWARVAGRRLSPGGPRPLW